MNDERMGNKKILPLLIEFSVPAIIGMLVNAIYNVVDRMFIGNAPQLGAVGIAGITISYPVTLVLMAISLMVGVGGATRFSISLGQKEKDKASIYQGNAIVLTVVFGLMFTVLGNIFSVSLWQYSSMDNNKEISHVGAPDRAAILELSGGERHYLGGSEIGRASCRERV